MYRMLIADDEALEREGLELIISRAMPGIFEIMHAENGRMAIQLAKECRPDIVLMDVKMPGIQGLDALRDIGAMNPSVKMVLVTAYDYFAYAKQALVLGVKDYIVKPAKPEQILSTLTKLLRELEQEKDHRFAELRRQDRYTQLMPLIENELSMMVITDQIQELSLEQMAEYADFHMDRCLTAVIIFNEQETSSFSEEQQREQLELVYQDIKRALDKYPSSFSSPIIQQHIALFIPFPEHTLFTKADINAWGIRLIEDLQRSYALKLYAGFGALKSNIRQLRESYREALCAADYASTKQPPASCVIYSDIADLLEPAALEKAYHRRWGTVSSSSLLHTAMEQAHHAREQAANSLIEQAKSYIDTHFVDELSMEEVAEQVHLNPFYFSKLFKQHIGQTFTDYVTQSRITLARSLLEENDLSLKEISYQVGYKDPNYFSRVFKKVTGLAPTEYRNCYIK